MNKVRKQGIKKAVDKESGDEESGGKNTAEQNKESGGIPPGTGPTNRVTLIADY